MFYAVFIFYYLANLIYEVNNMDFLINAIVFVAGCAIIMLPGFDWYKKSNEVFKTVIAFVVGALTFNFFLKFITIIYFIGSLFAGDGALYILMLLTQIVGYGGAIYAAMSIYSQLSGKGKQPFGIILYGLCTGLAIWAAIVSIQNEAILVGIVQIVSVAAGAYGLFKFVWQPQTA